MRPLLSAVDPAFLGRANAVIDTNLADENFGVDVLARELAVSRSLLYLRLADRGWSPARLILDRRLLRAAALLSDGALPVTDVAFAIGFKSAAHFAQCFREHFGVTPSAFRRNASVNSQRTRFRLQISRELPVG